MGITAVITSCGRHDLLKITLESLAKNLDGNFAQTIIVEDGPTPRPDWLGANSGNLGHQLCRLGPVTWIQNEQQRGQVYSIDTAYELVRTDLIFHCEDDWLFTKPGFLEPSIKLLEEQPKLLQVLLGDYNAHPSEQIDGWKCKTKITDWRGWGGFSWNPGLRRRIDYDSIGSYGRFSQFGSEGLGPEQALSQLYAKMGFRVGVLPEIYVQHLGDSRSVYRRPIYAHEVKPSLPKMLIIIPACHQYSYDRWAGDIHINGTEQLDRIRACRETWLKDVAAHGPELQYRFFYGSGGTRTPEADEVFLDVPDDYGHLPHKIVAAFRWARENGFEKVYKCDDDTYVWVDRLYRDAYSPMWYNQDYYGFKHNHGYITGGAGYILGGRALQIMSSVRTEQIQHWAEDVNTYMTLDKNNIRGVYHPGHQPGFHQHWYDINEIDHMGTALMWGTKERTALRAIHAVQPNTMRELYSRWQSVN